MADIIDSASEIEELQRNTAIKMRRLNHQAIIEQDPLVTIDITTHRHYGVGGQWVQDAGEYLHMMSDAGICIKGE